MVLDLVGIEHSELIDGEKFLGNWDSYYTCDLISVKVQSEDRNHTNILNRENIMIIKYVKGIKGNLKV